ncbi:MAG: hypothetical protein UY96_C0017G0054 [Parcubacteria group bacterium GW2011_GWB1_56_8]|nr:MAG: hypothetical protein UY96_C0017G0054 [Parcubacteria group bacterium GW2011_GWB1_56_8]
MQTQALILEIRSAEGGLDAKLLVEDQIGLYGRTWRLKEYLRGEL